MNAQAISELTLRRTPPTDSATEARPERAAPEAPKKPIEAAKEAAETAAEVPKEDLEQAADGVNAFLKSSGNHIQFAMHEKAHRLMVNVIDSATEEVIRTIPARELLDLQARIGDMVGMLLDKKT